MGNIDPQNARLRRYSGFLWHLFDVIPEDCLGPTPIAQLN
jgi:hypothetical protein